MWTRILSGLLWALVGVIVIVWVPLMALVWAVTAPFDRGRYVAGRLFRLAGVTFVKLNPLWRFHTTGERVDDPRRPYVVVSNHESYADVFLISHLPWEMKWLSKEAIFRVPLMGWMMRMAADIRVRRGHADSRADAFDAMRDRLARRVSVMIFPEGTRAPTDEMLPFRDGAFRLAVDTGCPILPLTVAGTRDCMKKGSFRFQRARAAVRVLEPEATEGLTMDDVPALRERVRQRIEQARAELRLEIGLRLEA